MHKFVDWVQALALGLGAPGLFLAAIADSSFLSLPEVVDILLIWMTTQHKSRMILYATSATLGSIIGCLILYTVGRKGDQFIARRFSADRMERALGAFRRYGLMAVLIPSLLPPPMPFKIFVLLAGAAGISTPRFVVAIALAADPTSPRRCSRSSMATGDDLPEREQPRRVAQPRHGVCAASAVTCCGKDPPAKSTVNLY